MGLMSRLMGNASKADVAEIAQEYGTLPGTGEEIQHAYNRRPSGSVSVVKPRTLLLVALTVTLVFGAAACASEEPTTGETTREPTPAAEESRTESASKALLAAIASGEESGAGMKAVRGVFVHGGDLRNVYFVAMEFEATGVGKLVGVWATNDTKGEGTIYAVDGTAQQYTVWPHGNSTAANITIRDYGAQAAKDALHDRSPDCSPTPTSCPPSQSEG
jgi:hypothetical protein